MIARAGQAGQAADKPGQSESVRTGQAGQLDRTSRTVREGVSPFRGNPRLSGLSGWQDSGVLIDLAARIDRLRPSHRDPEAFHVEKSEIAAALRRLAGPSRPATPCGSESMRDISR